MMARTLAVVVGLDFLLSVSIGQADDAKTVAAELHEVAGVWQSDWGLVTLKAAAVKGKKVLVVTGYYAHARDQTGLIKSGTFDPATGTLEFALEEPWNNQTKGTAKLMRSADGKQFKGHYAKSNQDKAKDQGMLHLSRVRIGPWKPADLAGLWDSPWGMITLKPAPVQDKESPAVIAYNSSYISPTGKDRKGSLTGSLNNLTGVFEITLEEPWDNETHGTATLTLSADSNRMQGVYAKVNKNKNRDEGTVSWLRLHGNNFAAHVDSIIADAGIKHDTPGAAVMVIEHGKPVFEKCYGLAHLKEKGPLTPRTTFELASCSKQFTGTAILLLYERGKLALDDEVRKYLPELPEYDKKNPIRILHLARQTSGLPEYMDFENVKGKHPKFLTNEDYVGEFARQRKKFPLYFPTGSQFRYTNTNFMLLALIVERVSKKSFGSFLKSEIFDPLGMKTASVYENPAVHVKEPALGYHKEKNKFEESWGPTPFRHETLLAVGDGAVWASLDDMARWDEGWRQGKVLKPATIKTALIPSTTGDKQSNDYAFGWGVRVKDGKLQHMEHNGGWGGFVTFVDRNVAEDRTLILLCNVDSLDVDALLRLYRAMPPKGK